MQRKLFFKLRSKPATKASLQRINAHHMQPVLAAKRGSKSRRLTPSIWSSLQQSGAADGVRAGSSNLHLGARDTDNGGFAMLGKTFKGLTDEMLRWQTEHLLSLETSRDNYTVYVAPELVVEIAYSDLQVSRRYKNGIALRFARVKRYRQDKRAEETDSLQTVRSLMP